MSTKINRQSECVSIGTVCTVLNVHYVNDDE